MALTQVAQERVGCRAVVDEQCDLHRVRRGRDGEHFANKLVFANDEIRWCRVRRPAHRLIERARIDDALLRLCAEVDRGSTQCGAPQAEFPPPPSIVASSGKYRAGSGSGQSHRCDNEVYVSAVCGQGVGPRVEAAHGGRVRRRAWAGGAFGAMSIRGSAVSTQDGSSWCGLQRGAVAPACGKR